MRLGIHSSTPAKFRRVMAGLAVFLVATASPALAQPEGKLAIELNKLTQEDAACRFYFLLENGTGYALTDVTVEFAFFDTDGIFAYRNLFSFGKLGATRNSLMSSVSNKELSHDTINKWRGIFPGRNESLLNYDSLFPE